MLSHMKALQLNKTEDHVKMFSVKFIFSYMANIGEHDSTLIVSMLNPLFMRDGTYQSACPVCSWVCIQLHTRWCIGVCLHALQCRRVCCHSHGAHREGWCRDDSLHTQSVRTVDATLAACHCRTFTHPKKIKPLTNVGVKEASRDQSFLGPEVPGSWRVATITSKKKKTIFFPPHNVAAFTDNHSSPCL